MTLFPAFLDLAGREVVVIGGGAVAAAKAARLAEAGARVTVIAERVNERLAWPAVAIERRAFVPSDLDGAWLVVAAATPAVNQAVARAAQARRLFVNAVERSTAVR